MDTDFVDGTFDSMLLNPQIVSPDDFDKDLSAAKAEDTLAAPGVDVARLKECIVSTSASVMGCFNDVPHTARGVLLSAPSPSPESSHCCPSDGGGERHTYSNFSLLLSEASH